MKHQACPYCPSSDAYMLYEDGHGYCYSCHKTTFADNIQTMKKKLDVPLGDDLTTVIDTSGFTLSLRSDALRWLHKYDITANEIKDHNIMWDTNTESLVFPVYNNNNELVVTNSRYFGNIATHPKYITRGNKTRFYKIFNPQADTLYLVEDYISAIKCARHWAAIPMFGTTLPISMVVLLSKKGYTPINVWLDPDKRKEALNLSLQIQQFGSFSNAIFTSNDPKSDL